MDESQLEEMMRNIWQSMILPETPLDPAAELEEYDFSACVDIVGPWNGAVSVECDEEMARTFAERMFERAPGQIAEGDLLDALREVANLIGGNVKGTLTSGCQLSLPRATRGSEALLLDGGQTTVCQSTFASGARRMRVRVLSER